MQKLVILISSCTGVTFAQVNPGIPQQVPVADLISQCQFTIQFQDTKISFFDNLWSLSFLKMYTLPWFGIKS